MSLMRVLFEKLCRQVLPYHYKCYCPNQMSHGTVHTSILALEPASRSACCACVDPSTPPPQCCLQLTPCLLPIQRWSSMTVASAFSAWLERVRVARENRSKVQGSLMRLLHRSLYSAFAAWQEIAADCAQDRAKVLSCLARISNRVRPCDKVCVHTANHAVGAHKAELP